MNNVFTIKEITQLHCGTFCDTSNIIHTCLVLISKTYYKNCI